MQAEDERRERLDYVGWGEKKSTRTPCPKRTFDEKSTRNRGNSRKKKQHCDGVACSTILCHMLRTRRGGGLYIFRFRGDEIAFCDIAAAAAAIGILYINMNDTYHTPLAQVEGCLTRTLSVASLMMPVSTLSIPWSSMGRHASMLSWRYCGPWDFSMMLMPSSSASLRKSGALLYLQETSFADSRG